jgi:hypothetical protein
MGLTKVGWTEDLVGRFKRHTSCCQTKFDKQHFPEDALVQIHDAYGCERAIHKHLKYAGRWPGPVACHSNSGKTHNEWFTGTRPTIVDVVKLYVRLYLLHIACCMLSGKACSGDCVGVRYCSLHSSRTSASPPFPDGLQMQAPLYAVGHCHMHCALSTVCCVTSTLIVLGMQGSIADQ